MKISNRNQLGNLLNSMNLKGLGAEIGVAYGHNAKHILSSWSGYGLFLIDPYDVSKCDTYVDPSNNINFDVCLKYCRQELIDFVFKIIHIRDTSNKAYEILKGIQLDFVYIDGNHHNPQVSIDLENYWNLVKPGGLLCGHDYYNTDTEEYKCEVKNSVDRFLTTHLHQDFFTTPECTSWYIIK